MSQENVEIVQRLTKDWASGDFSRRDVFASEVVFETPDSPDQNIWRGVDEVQAGWRSFLSTWSDFRAVPEDLIDAGDHVVLGNEIAGRGKQSEMPIQATTALVLTFRDATIVRMAMYWDRAQALEAVDLSEQDAHADS